MSMALDGLISRAEANGTIWMPMSDMGDLLDIARRVRDGDESGWRGDPSMTVQLDRQTGMFLVVGIDRHGNEYIAASHDKLDHTLLIKLRDGDPSRNDVIQRVLDKNARLVKERADAERERNRDRIDRLAHAIRKDFGGSRRHWGYGGTS